MREILFRGKRLDNGEWVEGWYEMYPFGRWPVKTSIIPSEEAKDGHYEHMQVDPSTIGQYTGLKDKNGKRIFEGDILRWTGEDGETGKVIVIFAGGSFLLKCVEVLDAPADPFDEFNRGGQTLEVIGNIHDNPELLEGGDEG